jgi:hypothetical protein
MATSADPEGVAALVLFGVIASVPLLFGRSIIGYGLLVAGFAAMLVLFLRTPER